MSIKNVKVETNIRQPITSLDVHPDGEELSVGQMHLYRFNLNDLHKKDIVNPESNRRVMMARYAPNGKSLAYIDSAQMLYFYDLELKHNEKISIKTPNLAWISYAAKANRLALAGNQIQVWDANEKKIIWALDKTIKQEPDSPTSVIVLSPDGRLAAICGIAAGKIIVYDVNQNEPIYEIDNAPDSVRWCSFDPTGDILACVQGSSDGVFLWEVRSGKRLLPDIFNEEFQGYLCLRFHPMGGFLALGMHSGYVVMINLDDGTFVIDEQIHKGRVWDLAFTPNGQRLFSGGDDAIIVNWDLTALR